MLISLAVLIIPVVALVWFFSIDGDSRPQPVDVGPAHARAMAEADYPVLRAGDLGEGWNPVRVAWAKAGDPWITSEPALGDSWQVGYLSPDDVYFGVVQRDTGAASFIEEFTREGDPVGEPVTLAEREWERYESEDGRTRSLVHLDGDVASVVSADADFTALEAFASTLTDR